MRTAPPLSFLCLFFILVSASDSPATQFYVDAGAKDVGDGSLDKPFATIQQAADIMKPGDVCIVREGVYRETVRPENSGTAEVPLVFRAFPGETVVLSGCDPVTGWTQEEGNLYSAAASAASPSERISMIRELFFFWLLTAVSWSSATGAENQWPRFRGPNADSVAPDHPGLPITWTTTNNVKWVADVPGLGWSCPVVWDGRVFLTAVVPDQPMQVPKKGMYLGEGVREPAQGIHRWMVYCFDLNTGQVLWKHEAHTGQPQVPRHP